jgi:hypothetical protein
MHMAADEQIYLGHPIYNEKADIFSAAVTIWSFTCGMEPYWCMPDASQCVRRSWSFSFTYMHKVRLQRCLTLDLVCSNVSETVTSEHLAQRVAREHLRPALSEVCNASQRPVIVVGHRVQSNLYWIRQQVDNSSLRGLLARMWLKNSEDRPSAATCLHEVIMMTASEVRTHL